MDTNQTPNNNTNPAFDPCGDTSPGGCAECPMVTECIPGDEAVVVDEAYITFHLSSGETDIVPLNEFMEMLDASESPSFGYRYEAGDPSTGQPNSFVLLADEDLDEWPEVISATAVFTLSNGFTEMRALEDVIQDVLDAHLGSTPEGEDYWIELFETLERFDIALPVKVTDPTGEEVEVDKIAGMWHTSNRDDDLQRIRDIYKLMNEEQWGETYESWDW